MSAQLRIPLTADQKRLIAAAAEAHALDMTSWARSVLVRMATDDEARRKGRRSDDD